MNGNNIAKLFAAFNEGTLQKTNELKELKSGLEFLRQFNSFFKFTPETIYYASATERIEAILENRMRS